MTTGLTNKWHWFGTFSVAPNGRLDAVWYDSRNAANNTDSQLFYSYSTDAGVTWSANVAVSNLLILSKAIRTRTRSVIILPSFPMTQAATLHIRRRSTSIPTVDSTKKTFTTCACFQRAEGTPTPTPTASPTPTAIATASPTATQTPTATATATATPTVSSYSATPTATATPTAHSQADAYAQIWAHAETSAHTTAETIINNILEPKGSRESTEMIECFTLRRCRVRCTNSFSCVTKFSQIILDETLPMG